MSKDVSSLAKKFLSSSNSDAVALAVIDFNKNSFEHFEYSKNVDNREIYYDLASLTKPLVNGLSFISEKVKDKNLESLINHRAGLPAWGLLPKNSWREILLSYKVSEAETLYSDFSALRFMLEFENITGKKLEVIYKKNLDSEILFWKELGDKRVLQYGHFKQKPNFGRVHDPNASNLNCFTSHAGLFGTIDGLARTLLEFNNKHDLLKLFNKRSDQRFNYGFDTVDDPKKTLAGSGCSDHTFGHLGFTGTSFWIDPKRGIGQIILSNATKEYWYDKAELNLLREEFGSMIWQNHKELSC